MLESDALKHMKKRQCAGKSPSSVAALFEIHAICPTTWGAGEYRPLPAGRGDELQFAEAPFVS